MKINIFGTLLAACLLMVISSCSDKDRPFTEFPDLEYGALPRVIDGVHITGNADGDAFDFNNIDGSGVAFTVEMFDENNGQNIESYSWTVAYSNGNTQYGPSDLGTWTKSDFSEGAEGLPTLSIDWSMSELMNAMALPVDSLLFGFRMNLRATVVKSDGTVFTSENTQANIQGQPTFAGLYQINVEIEDAPAPNAFKSDLRGVFTCKTTSRNVMAGIGWDGCEGNEWEGTVEWVQEHTDPQADGVYQILSVGPIDETWEDASMGAYYSCYGTDSQGSLPNGDLRIVDVCGKLEWFGASQWGEVFSFTLVEATGPLLVLEWENDYGEAGRNELTRTDGSDWPDLTF